MSNNGLFQSLAGLLNGASDCTLTEEPIPVWNIVRVIRVQADVELVRQTTMLMNGVSGMSINMPCAPMPVTEGYAPAFMHERLVSSLTGNQTYYTKGGLIPHLTKKGFFWKSLAPATHNAVLHYRLHIDPVNSAHLDKMDKIDCGWAPPLPRVHHYNSATGCHTSLGPDCTLKNVQYWVKQDGTTAKAASPAPPPTTWSNSVQGLTQHFEQMSMRNTGNLPDMGHIPDRKGLEHLKVARLYNEVRFFAGYEISDEKCCEFFPQKFEPLFCGSKKNPAKFPPNSCKISLPKIKKKSPKSFCRSAGRRKS